MNTDEIVRTLRICNNPKGHRCSECPIFSRYEHRTCKATVDKAAADMIESLQAQLAKKTEEAEKWRVLRLDADRIREGLMDKEVRLIHEKMRLESALEESQRRCRAAVEDLKLSNTRKFNNPCEICRKRGEKCAPVDLQDVCRLWEWRGPQEAGEVNQDG